MDKTGLITVTSTKTSICFHQSPDRFIWVVSFLTVPPAEVVKLSAEVENLEKRRHRSTLSPKRSPVNPRRGNVPLVTHVPALNDQTRRSL